MTTSTPLPDGFVPEDEMTADTPALKPAPRYAAGECADPGTESAREVRSRAHVSLIAFGVGVGKTALLLAIVAAHRERLAPRRSP